MQVSRVLVDNSKNIFGPTNSQRTDGASYVGVITFTSSLCRLRQEVVIYGLLGAYLPSCNLDSVLLAQRCCRVCPNSGRTAQGVHT